MYDKLKQTCMLIAVSLLVGCSAQSNNIMYKDVTASALIQECLDPVEVHNVPPIRFPIPAQVSRHHNCLGVADLLVITWPLDQTQVNLTAIDLLSLMYIEHENSGKTDSQLQLKHIKNDHFNSKDTDINIAFYELIEVILEKTE